MPDIITSLSAAPATVGDHAVGAEDLRPYTVSFRNPEGRRQTWTRFAASLEAAELSARVALASEYPDGQGGSTARLKMIEPASAL